MPLGQGCLGRLCRQTCAVQCSAEYGVRQYRPPRKVGRATRSRSLAPALITDRASPPSTCQHSLQPRQNECRHLKHRPGVLIQCNLSVLTFSGSHTVANCDFMGQFGNRKRVQKLFSFKFFRKLNHKERIQSESCQPNYSLPVV